MSDLTPHLSWAECLRGSGCSSPAELPLAIRANIERMALKMFAPLRERFGAPLIVVSGYRSPAVNKAVGGAKASQHMQGLALDLVPASKDAYDFNLLYGIIDGLQKGGAIPKGGLGEYHTASGAWRFVHVDARGFLARWTSGRVDRLVA